MSSSSTPPSIWPCSPEALAEQVCQSVLAAISQTAHPLAETMNTLTSTPSASGAQTFLASINPLLLRNLSNLYRYLLRNVFSLPADINPSVIAAAVQSDQPDNARTAALDHEIATRRAHIRHCDNLIARLTATHKTAQTQATAMRHVAPQSVAPQQFHTLCADMKAAEQDFTDVSNILREHRSNAPSNDPLLHAAANVLAKPQTLSNNFNHADENILSLRPSEEHEPLNHMPTAQGILGISMGADTDRLDDLATLRARLLG